MKKITSFWFVLLLSIVSFTAFGQEVDISIDHPAQVKAGEVFEVTVSIAKGSLTDYSRFSQDLPLGLTATNVSSPNADFSFDNQRIRIIWLKLPDVEEIKVSYNIMVDERLKGKFILGGVFAYVVEEERKFLNFEKSDEITIIPNPNVDPGLVVDIKDFKGGPSGAAGATAAAGVAGSTMQESYAMAIRQTPTLLSSGGYMVKILIQNPRGSKYAKVEEDIPSGYLFESVDSHDGIESFSSSTVKFIWMKLPGEAEFEVSYRLVPKRDEPQGEMLIKGELTYSAGNENKVVDIKQEDVDLGSLTLAEKRNLLQTGEFTVAAKTTPVVPEKVEPVEELVEPVKTTETSGTTIANTPVLAPEEGLYYRVQITAKRSAVDARSLFREAGVSQEIFVEQHEGYYKYTAGSFTSYNQAVSYRNQLEALSEINGAFVVAYRDGARIPMPSNN